jgi:photosystem II stability/assembly factor-like uncharacterized protein
MAHDVFISYASQDKTIADAVCAGLEKEGIRCWIAPRDILPSENYDDAIIKGIESARVMVVIFSSNIFQSQFVKSEVERAFSKGLIIAPFRIEDVIPKGGLELYLGRRHWLDAMTPPLENHIQTLAVTVRSMLALQTTELAEQAAVPFDHPSMPAAPIAPEAEPPSPGIVEDRPLKKTLRPAWLAAGTLAGIGILGGICLLVVVVLLLRNGFNGPRLTALSPTQPGGYPTAAGLPAVATPPPSSMLPRAPTALSMLPAGGTEISPANGSSLSSGTWMSLGDLPHNINAFVVDPLDPRVIYAAAGDYTGAGAGVYKSTDAGLTWALVSSGLPNKSIVSLGIMQPEGSKPTLLASLDNSADIYSSSDGAATWALLATVPGGGGNSILSFSSSPDKKRIYALVRMQGLMVSENNGQTWNSMDNGLPIDPTWGPLVQSMAVDPTISEILYAGTGGTAGQGQGVYKSTDRGETWSASNKGMLDANISALAVDPKQPQVIYAGSANGNLFKSADGGQTWTDLTPQLKLREFGEPRQIRSIQFDSTTGTVYLLGDNSGVLYSANAGAKWRLIGNPPGADQPQLSSMAIIPGEKPAIFVSIMGVDTAGGWRFGAGQSAPRAAPTASNTSNAPGKTITLSGVWQAVADLPHSVTHIVVDPADPTLIYAGVGAGGGGVYKSTDSGHTWKAASSGLNQQPVNALGFRAGVKPILFASVGNGGEFYTSQDQGQSWSLAGKTGLLGGSESDYSILSSGDTLYLISSNGAARSSNNGQTWLPLGEGLPKESDHVLILTLAIDPSDIRVMYAGTGGFVGQGQGVYKSTDGGETWTPSNKGMLDYRITALAVDPGQPQVVFAGSDNGDLFKSSDAGQTWTNLKDGLKLSQYGEPRQIRSIQLDPSTDVVYVLGDNSGLLYSTDSGAKWRLVGNPPGTEQPQYQPLSVIFGDNPAFFLVVMNGDGVWRFGH